MGGIKVWGQSYTVLGGGSRPNWTPDRHIEIGRNRANQTFKRYTYNAEPSVSKRIPGLVRSNLRPSFFISFTCVKGGRFFLQSDSVLGFLRMDQTPPSSLSTPYPEFLPGPKGVASMEIGLALFLSSDCFFSADSVNILGILLQALTKFAVVNLKLTGDLPSSHPKPRKSRAQQEPLQRLMFPSNTADVNPATPVMIAQPLPGVLR